MLWIGLALFVYVFLCINWICLDLLAMAGLCFVFICFSLYYLKLFGIACYGLGLL